MTELITDKELEEITKYLIKNKNKGEARKLITIYHKIISNYKYYKDKVSELELQIEELLDRDLI